MKPVEIATTRRDCNGVGFSSAGAAIFDMEYARWLDEDRKLMSELGTGLRGQLADDDLRVVVDECLAHHDEIFQLKAVAASSDVFHIITGMWASPAERWFLWMGGFRPSEILKVSPPSSNFFSAARRIRAIIN